MNAFLRATFCFLLPVLILAGCSKEEDSVYDAADTEAVMRQQDVQIQEYMASHNMTMERDFSGVHFKVEESGDNSRMTLNSIPSISYTRSSLKDTLLDASFGVTDFNGRALKDHILGWQIGLQKIGKGGKIYLIIPSPLGFGNVAVGNVIPANTILVCNVELVDFK